MAKLLAFNRATSKAVTLDTINGTIADVGAAIASLDTANTFDARSRDTTAVFLGDPYTLVRLAAGNCAVYKYSSASWASVASFGQGLNPSGSPTVHPVSLQVVNNTLVAVFYEQGTNYGINVRTSTDGATWSGATASGNAAWSDFGTSGDTIVWKNTIWGSSGEGIVARVISPAAWVGGAGVVDTGTDSGLNNALTQSGSFANWNGDLYFIRPDAAVPKLYKLPSTYSHSSVAAVAGWVNQSATGIPAPGALTAAADGGTYCLFTDPQDELCLWTNGANGIKLCKTTAATFPAFTDVTSSLVPSAISGLTAATTIGLYEDDRRRTNELHNFVFRTGTSSILATWDGSSLVKSVATHTATLLIPNDQKSDLRTFTDLQPAVFVTGVAQAFPGQATISYTLRESSSRKCSISPQYSTGGDTWSVMTQGSGGSATSNLTTSSAGVAYTFVWDAYLDLDGNHDYMQMRIVPNISGT